MEHNAGDVVAVTLQGLHLPVLVTRKPPQFYVFVISCGRKDFHCWVKGHPIHTFLVAVNDVPHFNLGASVELVRFTASFAHRLFF